MNSANLSINANIDLKQDNYLINFFTVAVDVMDNI